MIPAEALILAPIEDLQDINGVSFPQEPKFRQFLIIDQSHGTLGRNVLNTLALLLDGPDMTWRQMT